MIVHPVRQLAAFSGSAPSPGHALVDHQPADTFLGDPATRRPGDPATWEDVEAFDVGVAGHDLDVDAEFGGVFVGSGADAGVGPGCGELWVGGFGLVEPADADGVAETLAAVTITARGSPRVSVMTPRFRPTMCLPASMS